MIALVTDSTAPLTHAEAEKYGICVVPHSYTVDGTAYLEIIRTKIRAIRTA